MNENNQKPLFLLDIYGVLNLMDAWEVVGKTWWDTKGRMRQHKVAPAHLREVVVEGYRLLLHPAHLDMVTEIETVFEPVWATMWQDKAWRAGLELGFGVDWDYIDFDSYRVSRPYGQMTGNGIGNIKNPGIIDILGDRPGVWVDDDMTPAQQAWAQARTEAGIPTLFIQPDPEFGMTHDHFEQIMAFANELADASMVA
jgi:protein tyrosine phosphatase (PTP) superfamily phosphohydrolase (DUF442 family)